MASFEEMRDASTARPVRSGNSSAGAAPPPEPSLPLDLRAEGLHGLRDGSETSTPRISSRALYDEPELAGITHSFCLGLHEESDGGVRPEFSFEISAAITPALEALFGERITERIRLLNADFREAMCEHPDTTTPLIRLYGPGEGPFAGDSGKIKQTRVISVRS